MSKHYVRWFILLLCSLLFACEKEPSDQILEKRFYSHEATFKELLKIAHEDKIEEKPLYTVSNTNYKESKLSQARWNAYKKLFKEISVDNLFLK